MFTFAPSAFASEVDGVTSQVIEDNEYQRIVTAKQMKLESIQLLITN